MGDVVTVKPKDRMGKAKNLGATESETDDVHEGGRPNQHDPVEAS